MARVNTILGTKQVIANIRQKTVRMQAGYVTGLKLAGLFLQRESQKLVPVDTGNLKASAFTRASGIGFKAKVTVGYTAAYAIYVHENQEMKLKGQPRPNDGVGGKRSRYWDPQGRAQNDFLAQPARTRAVEMRAIIAKSIRLAT